LRFGTQPTKKPDFLTEASYLDGEIRLFSLAERTGLEPATPGVTGRYSNQLNYRSELINLVGAIGVEPMTFAL